MAIDYSGQTAIFTGGSSGIGWAVVCQLAKLGAAIVIADINIDSAEAAADKLKQAGHQALSVATNVADKSSVDTLIEQTLAWKPNLEILIHSAGIGVEKLFLETTLDEWNSVINIDLTGTFLVCQAAAKVMVDNGYGRIVNMASTAGIRGGTARAAYGAAKGGVITLTKVMAIELASSGITVNALAPGAIETDLVKKMHSDTTRVVYKRAIPMDRYGTPEEVAHSAVFLASKEAGYITGQIVGVDGGFLAAGVLHN